MIITAVLAVQICVPPPAALGDVLWFVGKSPEDDTTTSLCVMSTSAEADRFTSLRMLAGPPQAIAANSSTVWIAPPAHGRGGDSVSLLAIRADWDPRLETWMTKPATGMDRLPAVDLGGVDRLIASPQGPIIIGGGSGDRMVAVLRRGQWQRLADLPVAEPVHGAIDAGGDLIVLAGGEGDAVIWRCEIDGGGWEETPLRMEGDPRDLLALETGVLVGSQVDGNIRAVGFLQGDAVVPWIRLDDVLSDTQLLGSATDLMLYRLRDGTPSIAFIDQATGGADPWRAVSPASGIRAWSIVISVFIALAVVFVLFIGRGTTPDRIPEGLVVAPLLRRVLAFGIDLAPGVLVGVLVMDVTAIDVVSAAVTGPIPSTAILLLVLAAVTAVWGILWEALGRRATPGKRAMRLITASTRGGAIGLWQILVRNLLRGAIVLAPPIAIIVVLTPTGQSLGDVVAGTIVLIHDRSE